MTAASERGIVALARPEQAAKAPTRRFEARRRAILASAVEVLNRKGMRGMTLGEVAARLGLVPTGVIYYFKNKEELASACYLKATGRYDALIAEGLSAAGPRARIERFTEAYFRFKRDAATGHAEQIPDFNDVRALNSPLVNEAFVTMFRNARGLLDGPGEARLPRAHRNARTHILMTQMFWAVAWLRNFEPADYGRAAARTASILVDGMAAPGAAWPTPKPLDLSAPGDVDAEASSELFLRAATRLINAEGYHGASVERISAALNVSKGAFYHHNETKDELVLACFQRSFDVMWRAIRAAEASGDSGLEVLVSLSAALAEHELRGNAPLLRNSALSTVPENLQRRLIEGFDRLSLRFASILSDGIADGSVRPIDVNVGAQMITGMINAAAELDNFAPDTTPETAADQFVRPLFQGLLSPAVG